MDWILSVCLGLLVLAVTIIVVALGISWLGFNLFLKLVVIVVVFFLAFITGEILRF